MKLVVNMVMGDMMCALGEGPPLPGLGAAGGRHLRVTEGPGPGHHGQRPFKLKGPKMERHHAPNFPSSTPKDMRFAPRIK